MAGEKNLKIVKTKYFDVIYSQGSIESANLIYENGDRLYNELAEKLALKNEFRLPVVISPANQDFNAYFSSFPFNHIVIYDSLPDENLVVFADTFLNTFRHELIHAITYNLRSDALYSFDKIAGDVYNPALATITTAWAEGASVSIESDFGEGRMNSEYAKQMVKQAKIEGIFPSYADIQGARDIYPLGTVSYIFGGMFCKWLQENYGMEKYSQFWYRSVNFKSITYISCFKKVYGFSIKKAWNQFYESIEIPEGISVKKERKKLSLYKSLSAADNGYAFLDTAKCGVYYKSTEDDKARLIFTQSKLEKVNLSKDSRFMAVSYLDDSFTNSKKRSYIYDLKNRRIFDPGEISFRDGAVIQKGDEYFVSGVTIESEFSILKVYKLLLNEKKRIIGKKKVFEQKFEYSVQPLSLDGTSDGKLFFIKKNGLQFSLCELDLDSQKIAEHFLPDDVKVIQKLSCFQKRVYFSFVKENSFPRLGYYENGFFYLSKIDENGGIYNPIFAENNIYYIANYFNGNKIKMLDLQMVDFEKNPETTKENEVAGSSTNEVKFQILNEQSKKFSAFEYSFKGPKGAFIPVSLSKTYSIKDNAESMAYVTMPVGISYFSSSPWTYPIYYFTAGYGPLSDSYALDAGFYRGGLVNELFSYSGQAHVEFDKNGYKQNYESFSVNTTIPLYGTFYVAARNFFQFFNGRQSKLEYDKADVGSLFDYIGILSKENNNEDLSIRRFFISDSFSFVFGNIHKAGPGYFNYAGFRIMPMVNMLFCSPEKNIDKEYYHFENLSIDLQCRIPGIFPMTFEVAAFPSNCTVIYGGGNIVLYTWEIQKAIPFFTIFYLNRLSFSAHYEGLIKLNHYMEPWPISKSYDYFTEVFEGNANYYDEMQVKMDLYFNPNIGGLTRNEFMLKATFGYQYSFNLEQGKKRNDFIFGINFETPLF